MDAFAIVPPEWTKSAVHAVNFCCPSCKTNSAKAKNVWLNRRAPVIMGDALYADVFSRRKYQEFYLCECGTSWWGWSDDRPPSELGKQ
ncbi:MAG: hypothetical protein ACRDBG_27120 [Waterburya sp.]